MAILGYQVYTATANRRVVYQEAIIIAIHRLRMGLRVIPLRRIQSLWSDRAVPIHAGCYPLQSLTVCLLGRLYRSSDCVSADSADSRCYSLDLL